MTKTRKMRYGVTLEGAVAVVTVMGEVGDDIPISSEIGRSLVGSEAGYS